MTEPAKKGRNAEFLAQAGKGRPKGVPNKTTRMAKEVIAEAFERMGGTDALIAWADTNDETRKVFYGSIYTKLIPVQTELTGKDGGAIQLEQKVREDADAVLSALTRLTERTRAAGVAGGTKH